MATAPLVDEAGLHAICTGLSLYVVLLNTIEFVDAEPLFPLNPSSSVPSAVGLANTGAVALGANATLIVMGSSTESYMFFVGALLKRSGNDVIAFEGHVCGVAIRPNSNGVC